MLNGCPSLTVASPDLVCRSRAKPAEANATSAPAANGVVSTARLGGCKARTIRPNCRKVAKLENNAPATQAGRRRESAFARLPMDAMVAVLETKPEASPDNARPKRAPATRNEM